MAATFSVRTSVREPLMFAALTELANSLEGAQDQAGHLRDMRREHPNRDIALADLRSHLRDVSQDVRATLALLDAER